MSTISPINRYRFVELYYRRSEQAKDKDKNASNGSSSKSARIETTVIFLPDTSSIMPNRLEYEDVQLRYKEALQSFLASKEKPAAEDDEGEKEIPIITISDDNDAAMEVSAENVDDKNSVKKPVEEAPVVSEAVGVDAEGVSIEVDLTEGEAAAAAVVVNPDSSITDKALTDKRKQKFISSINPNILFYSSPYSLVLLLGSLSHSFLFCFALSISMQQNLFFPFFDPIIKLALLTSPNHHHPHWISQIASADEISINQKFKGTKCIIQPSHETSINPQQNAFLNFIIVLNVERP